MSTFNLLIVESPHKAGTIGTMLKNNSSRKWVIKASRGHVRDLPRDEYALTKTENGYTAKEVFIDKSKKEFIDEITKLAKEADEVYIATDEDREGEKISSDIVEYAKIREYKRVTFTEITERAVLESLNDASLVDENKVNSQRARRYIDRLGYKLSNMITWDFKNSTKYKKFVADNASLGIGRVICAATKLIVDNERARRNFVPEQYYQISVSYTAPSGEEFKLVLDRKFELGQKREMEDVMVVLKNNPHIVHKYDMDIKERSPYPPLTTATLQRAAFYGEEMRFRPIKTMELAQKLYESGFITYHRSDGANLSDEAIVGILEALATFYKDEDIAVKGRKFKPKQFSQMAHEAIRPCYFTPEYFPKNITKLESWKNANLSEDHWKLYRMIFFRTIMTQMADAVYLDSIVEIKCKEITLRGKSHYIHKDENQNDILGWLKIYRNILKEKDPDASDEEKYIPYMKVGDQVIVNDIDNFERKTQRPDRYGLGRFQTVLRDKGIGRPSTYALIPETICKKKFGKDSDGYMTGTELGEAIVEWCEEHQSANWLVDIDHAAEFEAKLDEIASGEIESPDELIAEYDQLTEQLKIEIGYRDLDELEPSEAMKRKIEAIASQKGIVLAQDIFTNYQKASAFLKANSPAYKKIGTCPLCKDGEVAPKEIHSKVTGEVFKMFSCSKRECAFKIYDNSIKKFFEIYKRDTDDEERETIIKGALAKKTGYEVDGLHKRDGTPFMSKVIIRLDKDYGWGLGFPTRKK